MIALYDSYCFSESLYIYYYTDREETVRTKRSLKIYGSSVSLHWYDSFCTDREATVRIKRSMKIWRNLSMIALFVSIGMIAIAFVTAYTCIIVQIEKRLYESREH